ncbi:hypothetical protein M2132_001151 [Dysgonomonas sp. PH5-45]|nr:hypothetical protein [Dysgonomonas sp. PH5-45]MDH6387719.1 hypothetical protein [Dysgonomonas sp. PH5-37]
MLTSLSGGIPPKYGNNSYAGFYIYCAYKISGNTLPLYQRKVNIFIEYTPRGNHKTRRKNVLSQPDRTIGEGLYVFYVLVFRSLIKTSYFRTA